MLMCCYNYYRLLERVFNGAHQRKEKNNIMSWIQVRTITGRILGDEIGEQQEDSTRIQSKPRLFLCREQFVCQVVSCCWYVRNFFLLF